jgi:hypothetical protein
MTEIIDPSIKFRIKGIVEMLLLKGKFTVGLVNIIVAAVAGAITPLIYA